MNPILAIGQLLVSIALIASILLQARGAGLSGAFGGDSAVYSSRRGVEKRLSTAPYCVGIPRKGQDPIVLDFATSVVAEASE